MQVEFYLHSKLEVWFAALLDDVDNGVKSWFTPKFIPYSYRDKSKKYFPDFIINDFYILELKSKYVAIQQNDFLDFKLSAAKSYCDDRGLEFVYWQFNDSNMSYQKLAIDKRVVEFFERLKNA